MASDRAPKNHHKFVARSGEAAWAKSGVGETDPHEIPKGGLSDTIRAILEMKPGEFEAFKGRPNLTKRELVSIRWVERLEELSLRGGPQILAEALDRLEGKVVIEHRLRGAGDRSGMSDAELDRIWRRRQSRIAEPKSPTK